MYTIKEAFPVEDGALHGPRGRYFLPILGTGDGKKMTTAGAVGLSIAVLLVTVIIIFGANWLSKDYTEFLTDYEDYVGLSKTEVVEALDIEAVALTELSANVYDSSLQTTLNGIDFDVQLYFEEHEELLRGYGYTTCYEASPEKASKDIATLINQFGYKDESGEVIYLDKTVLEQGFADREEFHLAQSWSFIPDNDGAVSMYLDHLENSDFWEGRAAGMLTIPAVWYRDLDISYDPHDQIVSIQLKYGAEPRRTGFVG